MQVGILYKIINFFLDARLKLGIITFCSVTGMVLPFQARFPRKCPPFRLIFCIWQDFTFRCRRTGPEIGFLRLDVFWAAWYNIFVFYTTPYD